jgi:hypothetical protein
MSLACGITSKTSVSTSTPIFQWHFALLSLRSMRGPWAVKMSGGGDIAIAAAVTQHPAADEREGIEIDGEELPAREQVLQSGRGGLHLRLTKVTFFAS